MFPGLTVMQYKKNFLDPTRQGYFKYTSNGLDLVLFWSHIFNLKNIKIIIEYQHIKVKYTDVGRENDIKTEILTNNI